MGSQDAFKPHTQYCPYCGAKIVREDNFCVECRRTFVDPPVDQAPHEIQPREYTASQNPWVSSILSVFCIGLGQFYNGDAIKGLGFVALTITAYFVLPQFIHINPWIVIVVIWIIAIADAYRTAHRVDLLLQPRKKRSVFFGVEILMLVLLVVAVSLPVLSPHLTAHSLTVAASIMPDIQNPVLPRPDYDTALSYAPNDTEIMIEKANYLIANGRYDDAEAWLNYTILRAPNDTIPVIMTGDFMYARGKYQTSIEYYDNALSMTPKNAQIWIKKGDAYLALSLIEMQQMREQYRSLTSNTPGYSVSASPSSLDAFKSTGSYRSAVKSYNEAIKIDPKTSVEISGRILASTQALIENYEGILKDIGSDNVTSNLTMDV